MCSAFWNYGNSCDLDQSQITFLHDQTSISHSSNLEKHQQKEILKSSRSAVLNNATY